MTLGGGYYYGAEMVKTSIIPLWLALSSLVFATLIGLVSGFYPANRAVKISALEAIKNE
jgi:ABC-type antimicrobial peptide transport system permease subunit